MSKAFECSLVLNGNEYHILTEECLTERSFGSIYDKILQIINLISNEKISFDSHLFEIYCHNFDRFVRIIDFKCIVNNGSIIRVSAKRGKQSDKCLNESINCGTTENNIPDSVDYNNTISTDSGRRKPDVLRVGHVVWANSNGHNWFPSVIVDTNGVQMPNVLRTVKSLEAVAESKGQKKYLVRFFDEIQSCHWLSRDRLEKFGVTPETDRQKLNESKDSLHRNEVKKAFMRAIQYCSDRNQLMRIFV